MSWSIGALSSSTADPNFGGNHCQDPIVNTLGNRDIGSIVLRKSNTVRGRSFLKFIYSLIIKVYKIVHGRINSCEDLIVQEILVRRINR